MSIADTFQSAEQHLKAGYDTIEAKGGTLPENLNLASLAEAVESIATRVPMGEYGKLIYVTSLSSSNDVVELDGVSIATEEDFNALCANSASVTIGGKTFARSSVIGFYSAKMPDTIPDYFLDSCIRLSYGSVSIPGNVVSIGNFFMSSCSSWNIRIVFDAATSLTSIGDGFLSHCRRYSPTSLDSSATKLESIGNYFMQYCSAFNGQVKFPETLKNIGDYFMSYCPTFNQPLAITGAIESIGDYFLYRATLFNQSIQINGANGVIGRSFGYSSIRTTTAGDINLTGSWKEIGDYFLAACPILNCPVTIAGDQLVVGDWFLQGDASFKSAVTFTESMISIGDGFMQGVSALNVAPTFAPGLVTIGDQFLYKASAFATSITTLTEVTEVGDYFLSRSFCGVAPSMPALETAGNYFMAYTPFVTTDGTSFGSFPSLKTVGNYFFYSKPGSQFSPTCPVLETVGSRFCARCGFTSYTPLPALKSVGDYFMAYCSGLQTPSAITLPSTLTTPIPDGFMYDCPAITKLSVPSGVTFASSNVSLSVINKATCISYTSGITVSGTGAAAVKTALPNLTTSGSPLRKLV